jgi:hypothetical protein
VLRLSKHRQGKPRKPRIETIDPLDVSFGIRFEDYGEQSISHNRDNQNAADPAYEKHPTQKVSEDRDQRVEHESAPTKGYSHYSTYRHGLALYFIGVRSGQTRSMVPAGRRVRSRAASENPHEHDYSISCTNLIRQSFAS